jgi:hypothetical protein
MDRNDGTGQQRNKGPAKFNENSSWDRFYKNPISGKFSSSNFGQSALAYYNTGVVVVNSKVVGVAPGGDTKPVFDRFIESGPASICLPRHFFMVQIF